MPGLSRFRDPLIAALLLALAALLRGVRLTDTPGWDGDEGYNLEIARQLLEGRAHAFALSQSFVQHPILFYALLAPLVAAIGPDLLAGRALAAAAGALTAALIYLSVVRGGQVRPAVLAGLAFAIAPFIVLHSRLAYTYNLLLLWSALTLYCVTRWEEGRARHWLVAASAAASLGLLTDQVGVALPLFVACRVLPRRASAAGALAAGLAPAALLAVAMLLVAPEAAVQDWGQSLVRVSGEPGGAGASAPAARVAVWFVNYLHLLRAEWWWPAAVIGLFCVSPLLARRRVLTLAGLMVVPTFALREVDPFFRTAIPLFLPGAIGLGWLLDAGVSAVYRTVAGRWTASVVTALVVMLPLGLEGARTAGSLAMTFTTRFDWALVRDHESARRAAAHVNERVAPETVVIVSPHVAWLYRGRVTDFFQTVAWTGEPVAFYPEGTRRGRFAFDPSPGAARFAVLDPFWERWAEVSPPVERLLAELRAWPEELRAGEFSVRRNPRENALSSTGRPATTR